MGNVQIAASLSGASSFAGMYRADWAINAAPSGGSTVFGFYNGQWQLGASLAGVGTVVAPLLGASDLAASLFGVGSFSGGVLVDNQCSAALLGSSNFIGVAILRPPFVAPPLPSKAPPNPFAGLQVGRQPPVRESSSTINVNPTRRRRPPEEPDR
jgi:hypothetical protein